jgi:uncharacterized membrane protein
LDLGQFVSWLFFLGLAINGSGYVELVGTEEFVGRVGKKVFAKIIAFSSLSLMVIIMYSLCPSKKKRDRDKSVIRERGKISKVFG